MTSGVGTSFFKAPETRGLDYSFSADMWSFGKTASYCRSHSRGMDRAVATALDTLVERCCVYPDVDARWTAEQAVEFLVTATGDEQGVGDVTAAVAAVTVAEGEVAEQEDEEKEEAPPQTNALCTVIFGSGKKKGRPCGEPADTCRYHAWRLRLAAEGTPTCRVLLKGGARKGQECGLPADKCWYH